MKNKVLWLLLSLVIAIGTWFYVITVVSPDSEITIHNVTVDVQGKTDLLDRNLVITNDTDNTKVDIVLNGNRTDLIKLSRADIIVTADVSRLEYKENRQEIPLDVYLPNTAVAVKTISPGQIYVTVEKRVTNREVRLDVNYDKEELPPDYIVKESLKEYPEFITVSGPESLMNQLSHAKIDLNLKEREVGFNDEAVPYTLYDKEGQVMDHKLLEHSGEVEITLPIYYTKRLALSLNLKDGGGATAQQATVEFFIPGAEGSTEPDSPIDTIAVSGSKAVLEQVEKLTLATVDLANVRAGEPNTYVLSDLPLLKEENINNESGLTEIYAKITFEELEEREFKSVTIETRNVPENLRAILVNQWYATVVVRGPANLVKKLTVEDFHVVIDLSKAEPGKKDYPVKIVFEPGFEELGALTIDDVQVDVVEIIGAA